MKTLIAIPCMDTTPIEFDQSMIYLSKGENVSVMYKPNSLVYDSRNLISLSAIDNNFDRVMWFDSDMVFQPDTLKTLHEDMDNLQCDMVTGIYFKRYFPTAPVIYERIREPERTPDGFLAKQIEPYYTYPQKAVFTVDGCGFGCVLTSVKLLKEVWDHFGPAFTPYPWAGEDISFCHRVNQLGHTIWCDSNVLCGHIGKYIYTEKDYLAQKNRGDADEGNR